MCATEDDAIRRHHSALDTASASGGAGRVEGRVFIVGAPRSGTTLVQSMLTAHDRVLSFPESHFFRLLRPTRRALRLMGLASRTTRDRVAAVLDALGCPDRKADLPRIPMPRGWWARRFVALLDAAALAQDKTHWIEKTPDHVHHIPTIERYVPEPRFVHILRRGADVVASLYDVTRRYPDTWEGPWDIDQCIRAWNRSVRASRAQLGRSNHRFIGFEAFVGEPEEHLRSLCRFLGLACQPAMLRGERSTAVVRDDEPWKRDATGAIQQHRLDRLTSLFSAHEQRRILDGLDGLEWVPG